MNTSNENHGFNFILNHLGAVGPKNGLNFFKLTLDNEKVIEMLKDVLKNPNATIKIEFEDFTMEIK
jgi:predicted transcriptional regulator with HTH domain